ncbi:MAG: trypsin-like serine protease [Polyangiaceae bacterium]
MHRIAGAASRSWVGPGAAMVVLGWGFTLLAIPSCSTAGVPDLSAARAAPSVDTAFPLMGVPDRGDDPAVVAIGAGDAVPCAGALIAPDVVLTARHCVSEGGALPSCSVALVSAESLRVFVGADRSTQVERARGLNILVYEGSSLCDLDAALVLLDRPIDDVEPLPVRATGVAAGDHVRTVGFGLLGNDGKPTMKLLREHVPVTHVAQAQIDLGEAGCFGPCGGPALDEATGEVVGVGSRRLPGSSQRTAQGVYVRADAIFGLIEQALGRSVGVAGARLAGRLKAKKGPVDIGANCARGSDCAAGACVLDRGGRYCSRTCEVHDRCPAHFRCEMTAQSIQVCVES